MEGVLTLKKRVIDLELAKISMKKFQVVISFDREVGWRRVKNESCSKRGTESHGQCPQGIGSTEIPKIYRLLLFFYF